MTTVDLLIVCATLLAALAITFRAILARDAARAQLQREVAMHGRAAAAPVTELAAATRALVDAAAGLSASAGEQAPPRVGHRVTVHTKKPDDQTVFGVLVGDYADRLVLEDAEYVTAQGGIPISGRQHFAIGDVAWVDVHALVALPDRAPAPAPAPEGAEV